MNFKKQDQALHTRPKLTVKTSKTDYFAIKGRADSNCAKNPKTRKCTSGLEVTLNGASVVMRSTGQKLITFIYNRGRVDCPLTVCSRDNSYNEEIKTYEVESECTNDLRKL